MPSDKLIRTAFAISLTGHCVFLGSPGFNFFLPQDKSQPKDLAVELKIERPELLPKIEIMGQEKKFKELEQKPEPPKPELEVPLSAERITVKQVSQENFKERIDVINPEKEAMLRYQDMIKQRIEEARRYPVWAMKQEIEGTAHLYFTVLSNGIAGDINVVRSSGSSILDKEAVATVKRAGPFPPLPKEIGIFSVGMEVAIVFSLNNNQNI